MPRELRREGDKRDSSGIGIRPARVSWQIKNSRALARQNCELLWPMTKGVYRLAWRAKVG